MYELIDVRSFSLCPVLRPLGGQLSTKMAPKHFPGFNQIDSPKIVVTQGTFSQRYDRMLSRIIFGFKFLSTLQFIERIIENLKLKCYISLRTVFPGLDVDRTRDILVYFH